MVISYKKIMRFCIEILKTFILNLDSLICLWRLLGYPNFVRIANLFYSLFRLRGSNQDVYWIIIRCLIELKFCIVFCTIQQYDWCSVDSITCRIFFLLALLFNSKFMSSYSSTLFSYLCASWLSRCRKQLFCEMEFLWAVIFYSHSHWGEDFFT